MATKIKLHLTDAYVVFSSFFVSTFKLDKYDCALIFFYSLLGFPDFQNLTRWNKSSKGDEDGDRIWKISQNLKDRVKVHNFYKCNYYIFDIFFSKLS